MRVLAGHSSLLRRVFSPAYRDVHCAYTCVLPQELSSNVHEVDRSCQSVFLSLGTPFRLACGRISRNRLYIEDYRILECGIGLTDLVKRPTHPSAELWPNETWAGVLQLQTKPVAYAPRVVCFNG